MEEKLKMINHRQLGELRKVQYKKQGGVCAISGLPYDLKDTVVDHKHKLKSEPLGGPDGLGLVRGVIGKNINTFEGKCYRLWIRFGLREDISLPDLLRRMADYIEKPPMNGEKIVHPKERPKRPRLKIPDYKLVCKYWFCIYPRKRTLPKYPGDSVKTPKWKEHIHVAKEWRRMDRQNKLSKKQRSKIKKAMELRKCQ